MKRILIVGKSFSGLTNYLRENGYDYIVLKDKATANAQRLLPQQVLGDFSSREQILASVDALPKKIDGVMTMYEGYVLAASWIAEHLGVLGLPVASAEACTDKSVMRELFAKAPKKISPAFTVVTNEDDVRAFASTHQFPLMLKPASLAKSLLITKNNDLEELLANYRRATAQIGKLYEKYAQNAQPKLLVEEYLDGSVHAVDAFIGQDGVPLVMEQIVDYQTGYDIGFTDNFHYSRVVPSKLSPADQTALRECAALGAQALGMKNSPAHIEIIMTKQGPRVVEIGGRIGGYRERMFRLANDMNVIAAGTAIALGEKPNLTPARHDSCAVLEVFPKNPGIFKGIANEQTLRALPSFVHLGVKATEETFVGKASDGYKMCAVVILHNADADQFAKDLDWVTNEATVITEPRTD